MNLNAVIVSWLRSLYIFTPKSCYTIIAWFQWSYIFYHLLHWKNHGECKWIWIFFIVLQKVFDDSEEICKLSDSLSFQKAQSKNFLLTNENIQEKLNAQ